MAEGSQAMISRRSTRHFTEIEGNMEVAGSDMRPSSSNDDVEKQREGTSSSMKMETGMIPRVDVGKDLASLFPRTVEDMGKQVVRSLQAAKASAKSKVDGRPLNFGTVLPGVYRSSFPQIEDFQFLGTLGLKTIVSLVVTEFSVEFQEFMRANGIRHCVIDMQGTKKVPISQAIMQSTMEVVLEKENHPLLIHCNHGKHRTGCAVAVVRHVNGWKVNDIVEEYEGHAQPKIRECDVRYITDYQVSDLQGLFMEKRTPNRGSTFNSSKMLRLIIGTAAAALVWLTTLLFWNNRELPEKRE